MAIPFTCPHCGTFTEVEDRYAGSSGPCATCGKTIAVPAGDQGGGSTGSGKVATAVGIGAGTVAIIASLVGVVIVGICVVGVLVALLLPAVNAARGTARRAACTNNLRQIGMAMQMYANDHGAFPPAYTTDEEGNPQHSWRVLLLPYLEEQSLYEDYNFDQPWDSPENTALASRMPAVYRCPADTSSVSDETSYLAMVADEAAFTAGKGRRFAEFGDGMSNTILVAEVSGAAVNWMEPRDLEMDAMTFTIDSGPTDIGSEHPGGANVVFADGAVHFLADTTDPEKLRSMITIDGGETVYYDY